jgi:hypothetical protein
MKKYRVRDDGKKEKFEVNGFQQIEAATRSFVTKAVAVTGLATFAGVALHAVLTSSAVELAVASHSAVALVALAVGLSHNKKPDG